MENTANQQIQVRDHYRDLAPVYNAKSNRTCELTYRRWVKQFIKGCSCVLELGAGGTDLLDQLASPFTVACDLSEAMLRMRTPRENTYCVVTAGERLPFGDESFDGLFHINVLEHVTDVAAVVSECARVLQSGGIWLGITPNGNWEYWLDLAERWHLKIPEGPHAFLTTDQLRDAVAPWFKIVKQQTFLIVPAGPPSFAGLVDHLTLCSKLRWGFFQILVATKE